jgi:hypothetical protein
MKLRNPTCLAPGQAAILSSVEDFYRAPKEELADRLAPAVAERVETYIKTILAYSGRRAKGRANHVVVVGTKLKM